MELLRKIIKYLVISAALIVAAAFVMLQLPQVQSRIAEIALEKIKGAFDADVKIGQLAFKPFNTLVITDLDVIDRQPYNDEVSDTLLHAGYIKARFSLLSLVGRDHQDFILRKVSLEDAAFNLVIEGREYSNNLTRMFRIPMEKPIREPKQKDIFRIDNLEIRNMRYTMRNFTHPDKHFSAPAIDWFDFEAWNIHASVKGFRMSHGKFYASVDELSFTERTGISAVISGSTVAGLGDAVITDLFYADNMGSTLLCDFEMIGRTPDFRDYIHRVEMVADVKDSHLSFASLSHFIPVLNPDPDTYAKLTGHAHGKVCDLYFDKARLAIENSSVSTVVSGNVKNFPKFRELYFDASLNDTKFTTKDATKLMHAASKKTAKLDISRFGTGELFDADIRLKGQINRTLEVDLGVSQGTHHGSAGINASISGLLPKGARAIEIDGAAQTTNLDLGKLLGNDKLGTATLNAGLQLRQAFASDPLSAAINAIDIDNLSFNGYTYRDISGNVQLYDSDFTAAITSNDPALDADINIWTDKYAYNGSVNMRNADLYAMNFSKKEDSQLAFNMYGHLEKDMEHIQGNANLTDIQLISASGAHSISDITLSARKKGNFYDASINSQDLDAAFRGNLDVMDARLNTKNTTEILAFLIPGAYLDNGTSLRVKRDSTGFIDGTISSHRIALRNNYIKDITGLVHGTLEDLDVDFTASEISAAGFNMQNNKLSLCLVDSVARMNYSFHNEIQNQENSDGDISIDAILGRNKSYTFNVNPSHMNVRGSMWDIPASTMQMQGRNISVNRFQASNGEQLIFVDGRISEQAAEKMNIVLQNIDVSIANGFISKFDLDLQGSVSATASITSPMPAGSIGILNANLSTQDLMMGAYSLGNISAICSNSGSNVYNISAMQHVDGRDALVADAALNTSTRDLDASISTSRMPLGFAQKFIPRVFSHMDGTLSGDIFVQGPLDRLEISSRDVTLDNGVLEVAFTHVPYYVSADLDIDNDGIHFGRNTARDRFGAIAQLSGGLEWDRFRKMNMNTHISMTDMEVLNIPSNAVGMRFYGQVFGTGTADFNGPFKAMTMTVNAVTAKRSDMHFSMAKDMDATTTNLLTFVDPGAVADDPYEIMLNNYRKSEIGPEFKMKMHASASPNFTVLLDLGNNNFSSGLEGIGNGEIDMDVNASTREYSILGDYTISEGKVEVNASNIVRRLFQIEEGSSIRFNGAIVESTVDLKANYETKASLETLLADKDAVSNRRTVNCGISITDRLNNPTIKFSIDVPDLNPNTRSSVEGALSTDDKVQKQFLSLLLSNNFMPDEQTSIVNNSSLLYSNVFEMMANQVNNILNKLDIPLDLGLNYQPTDTGVNLFDVALSTQLFNNRVIIGGNFGNRQNLASNSGSFFGDLDIQYKVTSNGAFRIKAFSHSADQYSNYLDNGQRNGVGLSWQQEFDSFPTWFKRLFSSKAQKEVLESLEATRQNNKQTLVLDE